MLPVIHIVFIMYHFLVMKEVKSECFFFCQVVQSLKSNYKENCLDGRGGDDSY